MAEITENFIDIRKVLAAKGLKKVPSWVVALLNRLLHVDELKEAIYAYRDREGVDFAQAVMQERLNISIEVEGAEHIPTEGNPIIAGNHPLGGADGLALISVVGSKRRDVKFPVNDFLMYLPNLKEVFVPVDKVHRHNKCIYALEEAFAGSNALLYFPAGICSRKGKEGIRDLEWKPTFVKKAIQYGRDVVPVHIEARNRRRFYWIANLRKRLGIRFNFEMALLPGEMFAQRGKRIRIVFGEPIPWQTFAEQRTAKEWAAWMREKVYEL